MAREPKSATNIQVFRGGLPQPDVFAKAAMESQCCNDNGLTSTFDKLPSRLRFDNGLNHMSPLGGREEFTIPVGGANFAATEADIINHINAEGVGATISVLAIPTYAFVTGVGIHIEAEEAGLTFDLKTRNGLVLPGASYGDGPANGEIIMVTAEGNGCTVDRTQDSGAFEGFGGLDDAQFIDIFGRYAQGNFALDADEIMLEVASMPASGVVTGAFRLTISVAYEVIHRAVA